MKLLCINVIIRPMDGMSGADTYVDSIYMDKGEKRLSVQDFTPGG